jgi:DeoR family glycerol-3-phosphate regulon repressor
MASRSARRTAADPSGRAAFAPNPRQTDLVAAVRQHGALSVEALAERFGVTLQTVRRDVGLLAEAGLLARFHGGVRVPADHREHRLPPAPSERTGGGSRPREGSGWLSLIINIAPRPRHANCCSTAAARDNNLNVAAILSDQPDCEVTSPVGLRRARPASSAR